MIQNTIENIGLSILNQEKLRAAISTMRKTPNFGCFKDQVDFQWPAEKDLMGMPIEVPIKITDLQYKVSSKTGKDFGAFQLTLSNGI